MDERDERKLTPDEASKTSLTTSKPGSRFHSGKSMEGTCLLIMRCPVYKGRESHLGSCAELGNLFADAKGKGTSGETARPKVPMRRTGADCSVVVVKSL